MAYVPGVALLAALVVGCSADADSNANGADSKAGSPTVTPAPPGKYLTLPAPCRAVPRSTLKDLLPGAAELPGDQQEKVFRGTAAVTYDTDRKVGCSWKSDAPDATRSLSIDFERVVSYDPAVSDDDRADTVYAKKEKAMRPVALDALRARRGEELRNPGQEGRGEREGREGREGRHQRQRGGEGLGLPRPLVHRLALQNPRRGRQREQRRQRRAGGHPPLAHPRQPRRCRISARSAQKVRFHRAEPHGQRGIPHIERGRDRPVRRAVSPRHPGARRRGTPGEGPGTGPETGRDAQRVAPARRAPDRPDSGLRGLSAAAHADRRPSYRGCPEDVPTRDRARPYTARTETSRTESSVPSE